MVIERMFGFVAAPDVYSEARVISPPARVLARTPDGVWTGNLYYWLRSPDGQWWGHVEAIEHHPRRRAIVPGIAIQPLTPAPVQVFLDDQWQPGQLLGWRTITEHGQHGWQGYVHVRTRRWGQRHIDEHLWFRLAKIRGAEPPAAVR